MCGRTLLYRRRGIVGTVCSKVMSATYAIGADAFPKEVVLIRKDRLVQKKNLQ